VKIDGDQSGGTSGKEYPESATQHGRVLGDIGCAEPEEHAVERERGPVETILAVERGIGDDGEWDLRAQQHVGAHSQDEMESANQDEDRRDDAEKRTETLHRMLYLNQENPSAKLAAGD